VHKPKNVNSRLVTKTNMYYIDSPWATVTLKLEARQDIILEVLNLQLDLLSGQCVQHHIVQLLT